jgi:hypothetical protein
MTRFGLVGIGFFAASFTMALADDPPAVDLGAVSKAIRQEDANALRTLLLPQVTTAFGRRIQTRDVNLWLMRSDAGNGWAAVHMCLEARIEDEGAWTDWLPAAVWAFAPIGDQHAEPSASMAGWDVTTGTRRFASLKEFEPAAILNSAETIRTECYHMNDGSQAAMRDGLLKHLSPQ